jgi:hypothetical protein
MYIYRITFLGGGTLNNFRANSPKEAYERAKLQYQLEVVHVKFLR